MNSKKPAFFIILLILNHSMTMADNVVIDRHYLGAKNFIDFTVPSEELKKVRSWEPRPDTNTPLSRDHALKLAQKAASAEGLIISDPSELRIILTKTSPFEEELVNRLPQNCCRWFYLIDLQGGNVELKGKFTYLVTMSGFVAVKNLKTRS